MLLFANSVSDDSLCIAVYMAALQCSPCHRTGLDKQSDYYTSVVLFHLPAGHIDSGRTGYRWFHRTVFDLVIGTNGSCLATTDPGFTGLWSVTRQPVVRAGQIVLALEDRSLPGKEKSTEQSRSHWYLRTSAGLMEAARYAG